MDLSQLKTLVAIAEYGTFARAASYVHLSPSAVSQQMHALETEIGTKLFNREKRPPALNINGLKMLETAKNVIQMLQDTNADIHGDALSSTLTVGSVRTSTINIMPHALVKLRSIYPELRVKLRVGMSNLLINDVLAGRLDIAIVAENIGKLDSLRWMPFIREPLFLIAPPGTATLTARALLEKLPYIRFSASVPLAFIIDTEIARMGINTVEIAEIDTSSAIVECVSSGLGVGVIPHVLLPNIKSEVTVVPFGEPQCFRQMGMVVPRHSVKQALFNTVHCCLAEQAGEFGVLPE